MKQHFERIGHDVSVEHAHRSCLDKLRFDSRNKARDFAARATKRFADGVETRPYRCTICNGFHLTTRPKSRPRTKKA